VDVRLLRRAFVQPEVRLRWHAHPQYHHAARELDGHLHQHLVAERRERLLVKTPGADRITDADAGVIDHRRVLTRARGLDHQ
jgi:hypothetical protein